MTTTALHALTNRRQSGERRHLTLRTILCSFTCRRRHRQRRLDEHQHYISDRQEPWILFTAAAAFTLSMVDALMTLKLLDLGAKEVNPVMALVVHNPPLFFTVKSILTLACVLPLVLFRDYKLTPRMPLSRLLLAVPAVYVLVVGYELVLVRVLQGA